MIGFEFPMVPAGMVRVIDVPCAFTPFIACVPSADFTTFGSAGLAARVVVLVELALPAGG